MSIVLQHVHEVLADVPPQEVVPYGALEGVPAIQQDRLGLRLEGLLYGCVKAGEAPDARVLLGDAYCALWTNLVKTGGKLIGKACNFLSKHALGFCSLYLRYPQ